MTEELKVRESVQDNHPPNVLMGRLHTLSLPSKVGPPICSLFP